MNNKVEHENSFMTTQLALLHGDFRDVMNGIPDSSIAPIITHPPQTQPNGVSSYYELGQECARVLKPGGSLVAVLRQDYFNEVNSAILYHLNWHWLYCYLITTKSTFIPDKNVVSRFKPIVQYVKGNHKGKKTLDVFLDKCENSKNNGAKQNPHAYLPFISNLTEEQDIILDPCVGSGATAAPVLGMGRRFIGIDKDEANITKTRRHIANSLGIKFEQSEWSYPLSEPIHTPNGDITVESCCAWVEAQTKQKFTISQSKSE